MNHQPSTDRPLVSVIIPCYNYGRYLSEAIDSVLAQTYRPIEIIVGDDGSTDDTEAVARRYGEQIRYIRRENGGQADTRNAGFAVSTGAYIQFLDADDLLLPEKLATQVAVLEKSPAIDVCYTNYRKINIQTGTEALTYARVRLDASPLVDFLLHWETELSIPLHTVLFRRSIWSQRQPFHEGLRAHEDWEMWVDLALRGARFEYLDYVGAVYRLHPQSTNANNLLMLTNTLEVVQIIQARLPTEYQTRFEDHAYRLAEKRLRISLFPHVPNYETLYRDAAAERDAIKTSSSWRLARLFSGLARPFRALRDPSGNARP